MSDEKIKKDWKAPIIQDKDIDIVKEHEIDKLFAFFLLDLAEYLDKKVYLPIKKEIGNEKEHTLGIRKEQFKAYMETKLILLRDIIKKDYLEIE